MLTKNFGEVITFVKIDNTELKSMLSNAGEYIMFNIGSGDIRALDGNRTSVHGKAMSEAEVFYKLSTSQVKLLLDKGMQNSTSVEMRPETLTLTNGVYTLEMSFPCPPICD